MIEPKLPSVRLGVLILSLLGTLSISSALADSPVQCHDQPIPDIPLNTSVTKVVTRDEPFCFTLSRSDSLSEGEASGVQVRVSATEGEFDVYHRDSVHNLSAFTHKDKVTKSAPIRMEDRSVPLHFRTANVGSHLFAVALTGTGNVGTFRLTASSLQKAKKPISRTPEPVSSSCTGDICQVQQPLQLFSGAIPLDPEVGNRAVFPFSVVEPSWVSVGASWQGPPTKIVAQIYGPGNDSPYRTVAGQAFLGATFYVDQNMLKQGEQWTMTLINETGGIGSNVDTYIHTTPMPAFMPLREASVELGWDRSGQDFEHRPITSGGSEACRRACIKDLRCAAYTFTNGDSMCHLKSEVPDPSRRDDCTSGVVNIRLTSMQADAERTSLSSAYSREVHLDELWPEECRQRCATDPRCGAFTFSPSSCKLHAVAPAMAVSEQQSVSGRTSYRTTTSEPGRDRYGMDYDERELPSPALCALRCASDMKCLAYTYTIWDNICHLKDGVPDSGLRDGCISGVAQIRDFTTEVGQDRRGFDYRAFALPYESPELCRMSCAADPQCQAYTYTAPEGSELAGCWLKNGVVEASPCKRCVGGVMSPPQSTASLAQPGSAASATAVGVWVNPKDGAEYVYVPASRFLMGSSDSDIRAGSEEKPQNLNYTDGFWIMRAEVSNAQYALCVDDGVCTAPGGVGYVDWSDPGLANYPVVFVDWQQAKAYAAWAGGRLPTEAEWEKGCRGTDGHLFPWGDIWDRFQGTRLNFCDANCSSGGQDTGTNDGYRLRSPVGIYPEGASRYGALDMAGNAQEWVSSSYKSYPYSADDGREDGGAMEFGIARGGSFVDDRQWVRCASRYSVPREQQTGYTGFRVVILSGSK